MEETICKCDGCNKPMKRGFSVVVEKSAIVSRRHRRRYHRYGGSMVAYLDLCKTCMGKTGSLPKFMAKWQRTHGRIARRRHRRRVA